MTHAGQQQSFSIPPMAPSVHYANLHVLTGNSVHLWDIPLPPFSPPQPPSCPRPYPPPPPPPPAGDSNSGAERHAKELDEGEVTDDDDTHGNAII